MAAVTGVVDGNIVILDENPFQKQKHAMCNIHDTVFLKKRLKLVPAKSSLPQKR